MNRRFARLLCSIAIGLAAAWLWLALLTPPPALGAPALGAPASGTTFVVDSTADLPDATPNDGVCATAVVGQSFCTLRAAIQQANARPGADTIQLQANTYRLTRVGVDDTAVSGDLDITDSVTILGAGPGSTIIDGNGTLIQERVFQITGTVTISGVTIEHGQSSNFGGGLINNGALTLINTVVYSNVVSGVNDWGGGIYSSGPLTITNSSIRENATGNHNAYGGGILNNGPLLIINSTISGNVTYSGTNTVGPGGGLYTSGYTVTVVDSTINDNTAGAGGGIYKVGYPLAVINSTISGNHSTISGGGIYAASGSTSLYNVTVSGNLANSDNVGSAVGGGVVNATGNQFNFINSIIAGNGLIIHMTPFPIFQLDDCYGTINSQADNIMLAVDTGICTVSGIYTQTDPLLGPLQDNGGPTLTHALLPGSPAIDAVRPSGCLDNLGGPLTTDQRGFPRPSAGHGLCDIGAFEFSYQLNLPLVQR